jgi:hypothetical protein
MLSIASEHKAVNYTFFLLLILLILIASPSYGQTQVFTDVTTTSPYYDATRMMYALGVTTGCTTTPLQFCPQDSLLRKQMAAFIIRAWSLKLWGDPEAFRSNSPPSPTPYFTDATNSSDEFFPYIQKMKELGITNGCTASQYCPDDTLQNHQIAVFVTRARVLADGHCTTPCGVDSFAYTSTPYFADVPTSDSFFKWIQRLADLQAVSPTVATFGCSLGNFCPYFVPTARGEMAKDTMAGILRWDFWQSYAGFKACIGTKGSGDCELDPPSDGTGIWDVSETLQIQRSNFVALGNWTGVTLRRAVGFTGTLLEIAGVANVTLNGFTIDGNFTRGASSEHNAEVEIGGACSSCRVFSNTFQDSPNISLAISSNAFATDVRYNTIRNSYKMGLWSGAGSCASDPYWKCLYLYSNTFQNNGTNAIFLSSTRANIGYNTLTGNHRRCTYDAPGGQIDLDVQANDVSVFWNTIIDGPSCPVTYPSGQSWWAQGLELHGANIIAYDNIITGNAAEGIYMEEAQSVSIYATDVNRYIRSNNIRGSGFPGCGGFPGIRVHSSPGLRQTQNISIGNTSIVDGHSWGMEVSACPGSVQNASSVVITNNCFRGNSNIGGIQGVNVGPGNVPGLTISGNLVSSCGPN